MTFPSAKSCHKYKILEVSFNYLLKLQSKAKQINMPYTPKPQHFLDNTEVNNIKVKDLIFEVTLNNIKESCFRLLKITRFMQFQNSG